MLDADGFLNIIIMKYIIGEIENRIIGMTVFSDMN